MPDNSRVDVLAAGRDRGRLPQPLGRGGPAPHFPCEAQPHPRPPVPGRARLSRRAPAPQTPGPGGPPLELGDDPPPTHRLGPPHRLTARGRQQLDPVPSGLLPIRQSRRTGPGHRPDAGPASASHLISITCTVSNSKRTIRHGPTSTVVGRVLLAWSLYDARSKCV